MCKKVGGVLNGVLLGVGSPGHRTRWFGVFVSDGVEELLMNRERGAALAITIMIAVIMSISIYAILVMASSQARQAAFNQSSIRARYAAEVGLVWAQQRLRADSTYCGDPPPPPIGGMVINVIVNEGVCPPPASPKIRVEVQY
jgi:hypothetical protein